MEINVPNRFLQVAFEVNLFILLNLPNKLRTQNLDF